jgi:signal peptidase I
MSRRRRLLWLGGAVLLLGLVTGALRLWVFDLVVIKRPSQDMWPDLGPGMTVLVNRHATPARGDLVMLDREGGGRQILRVVALPGETVGFVDSRPYVDGVPVSWREVGRLHDGERWFVVHEERLGDAAYRVLEDPRRRMSTTFAAPTGDGYYLLADNREHMNDADSRGLGPVPGSRLRGVVIWVIDPGQAPVYYAAPSGGLIAAP